MFKVKKNFLTILIFFVFFQINLGKSHPLSDEFADLVEGLSPAVVNVFTTQKNDNRPQQQLPFDNIPPQFREFFKNFPPGFGPGQPQDPDQKREQQQALGSGFVIDPTGYIVTNHHVIAEANEIKVKFQDDKELTAKLIGQDKLTDLALLKVESKEPLKFVNFANSDKARVGHSVIAIGNPFGLGGTVTSGIISAFNRDINSGPYDSFIQTDASINKGNSGGPLFNMKGDVVGINSAIFSPSGGSVGIGFSIPSNLAKPIIEQLRKFGKTQRGWLGVRIQEVTPEIAESLGLEKSEGVLISMVNPNEPAEKAGLRAGDVIINFNGKKVKNVRALQRMVAEAAISSSAKVDIWRNKKINKFKVKLAEREKFDEQAQSDQKNDKPSQVNDKEYEVDNIGLRLKDISDILRDQYNIDKNLTGAVVTGVKNNSPASNTGIGVGNVIAQISQKKIKTAKQAKQLFDEAIKQKSDSLLLQVYQNGFPRFVPLKLK